MNDFRRRQIIQHQYAALRLRVFSGVMAGAALILGLMAAAGR